MAAKRGSDGGGNIGGQLQPSNSSETLSEGAGWDMRQRMKPISGNVAIHGARGNSRVDIDADHETGTSEYGALRWGTIA